MMELVNVGPQSTQQPDSHKCATKAIRFSQGQTIQAVSFYSYDTHTTTRNCHQSEKPILNRDPCTVFTNWKLAARDTGQRKTVQSSLGTNLWAI